MTPWKDVAHFGRLIALFAIAVVAFFALRAVALPTGFGLYGHYRAPALNEIRARPVQYAGQPVCELCHADQHAAVAAGLHRSVHCEACHGPQARHADDIALKPTLPQTPALCIQCHEFSGAKLKAIRQVNTADHSGGLDCKSCHKPHNPKEGL